MDAIPVLVSLLLLGFSKGSNQLKKKVFLNSRQEKKPQKIIKTFFAKQCNDVLFKTGDLPSMK